MGIVIIYLFWLIGFFSMQGLGEAQSAPANSCLECHADMAEEMKGSIHSQHQVYCQHCHGGDPAKKDQEAAKDPATGYIGVPDKKQLVKICGECHADVEAMHFYGIRTGNLARYKTSAHGKKLFEEGNVRVAACTDCHGYHDVTAVSDPNNPVYPLNVPKTCAQCHGDEKLMSKHGLPSDQFKKYESSVHGKALFEKKDISVAQCASCHGGHGALPPGVKDVANTCGKCHVNEQKYFSQSAHAPLLAGQASITGKEKFTGCISCHDNHGVAPASTALYEQACGQCHVPGSPEFQLGRNFASMINASQGKLSATKDMVKQASIEGIFVEQEMALLEQAKTHVLEMAPLQHTLSIEGITGHYKKISETTEDIKTKIHHKRQELVWRKLALIPVWIFVFIMAGAFWIKYKRLKEEESEGSRHE